MFPRYCRPWSRQRSPGLPIRALHELDSPVVRRQDQRRQPSEGRPRKTRRTHPDVGTTALRTALFDLDMPPVTEWTVQSVKFDDVRVRVPVSRAFFDRTQNEFRSLATYLEPTDDCNVRAALLEQEIQSILNAHVYSPTSEQQVVVAASQVVAPLFEVVAGRQNRRDQASETTAGRPDDAVIMRGQQTLCGELKHNNMAEAKQDCVRKTPFDNWSHYYANLPLVFVYAMSGVAGRQAVEFGVLSRGERRWISLSPEIHLDEEDGRAELLGWCFRILPWLCATANYLSADPAVIDRTWNIEHESGVLGVPKRNLSISMFEGRDYVKKEWEFLSGPTSNGSRSAKSFVTAIHAVYLQLASIDADPPPIVRPHDTIPIHPVTKSPNIVHGYFSPCGYVLTNMTLDNRGAVALATQLLDLLRYLRERRVIHNDLRPANIICTTHAFQDDSRFLAIDFDDAAIVPDGANATVPGCTVFDRQTHAPNIGRPHGFEVDVWGVGFILLQKAASLGQLGSEVCRDYETLDVDELQRRIASAASPRSQRARQRAEH